MNITISCVSYKAIMLAFLLYLSLPSPLPPHERKAATSLMAVESHGLQIWKGRSFADKVVEKLEHSHVGIGNLWNFKRSW
jgi:hypothetical protein